MKQPYPSPPLPLVVRLCGVVLLLLVLIPPQPQPQYGRHRGWYCNAAEIPEESDTIPLVVEVGTNNNIIESENSDDGIRSDSSNSNNNHSNSSNNNACMTIDVNGNSIPNRDMDESCGVMASDAAVMTTTVSSDELDDVKQNDSIRLGSDIGVIQTTDVGLEDIIVQAIIASRQYLQQQQQEWNEDTHSTTTTTNGRNKCRNTHEYCTFWSVQGECTSNADYMHRFCAPACQTCHVVWQSQQQAEEEGGSEEEGDDNDAEIGTEQDERNGEKDIDNEEEEVDEETRILNRKRGSDIGVLQSIDDTEYGDQIVEAIAKTQQYMYEIVFVDETYRKVKELCRNTHESCTYWSLIGECTENPGFMLIHCAPACQTCDQVHVETRCPMNDTATNVFHEKDDLNQFYERIVQDPYYKSQFNVTVLSRPDYADGDSPENTTLPYVVTGLWVLQFDNIVNDTEAQRLIELGHDEGYKRSADVGEAKPDGTFDSEVNEGRTSTNAWCMKDCMEDPITNLVHDRMENITTIPRNQYENLQILQYQEHQYYNEHNDFIEYQVDRPCGSRILTFYIYLNTLPDEAGGGTNFPKLHLTVTPKLGRAILWPSILNDAPFEMDPLSNHQALPVLRNDTIKYGINAWIHQRDFQQANHVGCA